MRLRKRFRTELTAIWEAAGMPLDADQELQAVGSYDLVEKIGEGGMGSVFKGRHRLSGETVAVKVLPKHLASNPVHLKRFEQEYTAAKLLDHPNIVKALDFGRQDSTPYLVMEFVEGESLGQRLEREGKLSQSDAITIISEVAKGLHKAHRQGLVHRDVKPDNILLTSDGKVKLTDLGLVKEIDAELNLTRTGRGLCTPHFMAPEQFRNAKKADARCDIYSLAATLYMMVTGVLPFASCSPVDAWMKKINNEIAPPREVLPELSERLNWAISRSMNSEPTERAGTCLEFIEDITGHGTRRLEPLPSELLLEDDVWFMVYTDVEGVVHIVKGTVEGLRQLLRQKLIGDVATIRVSRSNMGPFDLMRNHPEFRDLVVETPRKGRAITPTSSANGKNGKANGSKSFTPVPRAVEANLTMPPHDSAQRNTPREIEDPSPVAVDPQPKPASGPEYVHIPIVSFNRNPEWRQWFWLLVIAAATGIASYYLMPLLVHLRLL